MPHASSSTTAGLASQLNTLRPPPVCCTLNGSEGTTPPLDRDDGGAGGGAVKVAGSLPLASLGDSPAVRRDAPPRSNRGRGLPFAVPAINPRREPGLRTQPAPPCSGAGRASTRQIVAGTPRSSSSHPQRTRSPPNLTARIQPSPVSLPAVNRCDVDWNSHRRGGANSSRRSQSSLRPSEMVWVHVSLATVTWLALLWVVAAAGRLAPRAVGVPAGERPRAPGSWSSPAVWTEPRAALRSASNRCQRNTARPKTTRPGDGAPSLGSTAAPQHVYPGDQDGRSSPSTASPPPYRSGRASAGSASAATRRRAAVAGRRDPSDRSQRHMTLRQSRYDIHGAYPRPGQGAQNERSWRPACA